MKEFKTSTAFYNINKETHSHIHSINKDGEPIEWLPIHSEDELHLAAKNGGSYYLATDINLTEELQITKDMNLCLNDKVLKQTAADTRVITVNENIHFNLCDCSGDKGTTRYWNKEENGLWKLGTDYISEYMTVGGVITGGYADVGGVMNLGIFTMYGGNITGNRTYSQVGGVLNWGEFIMYGGNISGNSGSGVYNYADGTFTLNGGEITGNTLTDGTESNV